MRIKIPGRGLAKAMGATLRHTARRPVTTQYPEERLNVSRRFRGQEHVLDPGLCTACEACARACPQEGVINLVTGRVEDEKGKKKKVVEKFEIDEGMCIFCGMCVEACPVDALFFGRSYERSRYRRSELISDKEELSSPDKEKSAYYYPELDNGLPEQDLLVYRKRGRL